MTVQMGVAALAHAKFLVACSGALGHLLLYSLTISVLLTLQYTLRPLGQLHSLVVCQRFRVNSPNSLFVSVTRSFFWCQQTAQIIVAGACEHCVSRS